MSLAHDVLTATTHPDTRRVRLEDRAVLRTPDRPDAPAGNAVHLLGPPPDRDAIAAALDDASTRLADPRTVPTVVARRGDDPVDTDQWRSRPIDVLVLPDAAVRVGSWPRRADISVRAPADDRAWHAVTVLRRHAVPVVPRHEDEGREHEEEAAFARGGRDDLLRWWVDGRRALVDDGRARVALAERFGTPVATATLVWDPGAPVDADHAGLAVVADLVVHPAHRGLGIAAAPARRLVRSHLADFPRAQVATVVPATATAALAGAGWELHDRLVVLTRQRGR